MAELSQDIRSVYQTFGRNDLSYEEISERLAYQKVVDKWPLLRLSRETRAVSSEKPDFEGPGKA